MFDKLGSLIWRVLEFLFDVLKLGIEAFAFEGCCLGLKRSAVLDAEGSNFDEVFGFGFLLTLQAGIKNYGNFRRHVGPS